MNRTFHYKSLTSNINKCFSQNIIDNSRVSVQSPDKNIFIQFYQKQDDDGKRTMYYNLTYKNKIVIDTSKKSNIPMKKIFLFLLIVISTLIYDTVVAQITVNLKQQGKPLQPLWAYFGYDEPNYTYMKDGKKLLSELAALSPVPVYVRCHNLLTTGDGTAALKWGST